MMFAPLVFRRIRWRLALRNHVRQAWGNVERWNELGFSSRHAFQAATPCLSNATCSSFAM